MSIVSSDLLTGFYGSRSRRQKAAEQNPKIDVEHVADKRGAGPYRDLTAL
ncbi:MAG: hypothetical protein HFI63_07155 [Lachnospiraceae bacterium]|nr:hypothetical protein [Lachnospiraceae bacterium]